MRPLLTITAILEAGTGLALLVAPSLVSTVLLGTPLESAAPQTVARVGGVALLALAVMCWVASQDAGGRASRGTISGMLVYNCGAVAVLAAAATVEGLRGVLIWPAAALHAGLAAWCIVCLRRRRGA